jgi:hypothetical protein
MCRWHHSFLCSVLLTVILSWNGELRSVHAQAKNDFALKITQMGGLVSKDLEGNIEYITFFSHSTPQDALEKIDFRQLRHLKGVTLIGHQFTDRSLVHLQSISVQLEKLQIIHGKITDEGAISLLKRQKQLWKLDLMSVPITDNTLAEIGKLTQLHWLHLRSTKISDRGLSHLVTLQQLRGLDIGNTNITDIGIQQISKMTKLNLLNLEQTRVSDGGITELIALKELQTLGVNRTNVTEEGKLVMKMVMPNLRFLDEK